MALLIADMMFKGFSVLLGSKLVVSRRLAGKVVRILRNQVISFGKGWQSVFCLAMETSKLLRKASPHIHTYVSIAHQAVDIYTY